MRRDRRPISHHVDVPRETPRPPRRCGRCDRELPASLLREFLDLGGRVTEREISDYVCGCVPGWAAEGNEA